ncbi:hypothetical protein Tco_0858418 [Tanacetum coccineum]|uniref:Uncharacterized protein n=1 Tax=Tanacetum coccineum TaxID=301880 RepID=A0ABQ5B932_9ASTR
MVACKPEAYSVGIAWAKPPDNNGDRFEFYSDETILRSQVIHQLRFEEKYSIEDLLQKLDMDITNIIQGRQNSSLQMLLSRETEREPPLRVRRFSLTMAWIFLSKYVLASERSTGNQKTYKNEDWKSMLN